MLHRHSQNQVSQSFLAPSTATDVESSHCVTCPNRWLLVSIANPPRVSVKSPNGLRAESWCLTSSFSCSHLFFCSRRARQCFEHELTRALLTRRVVSSLTLFAFLSWPPQAKANSANAKQVAKLLATSKAATPKDAAPDGTNTESKQSGQMDAAFPKESPRKEHPSKAETSNYDAVVDRAIRTRCDSHSTWESLSNTTGDSFGPKNMNPKMRRGTCPRIFGFGFGLSSTPAFWQRTPWRNQATTAAGHWTQSSYARLQSHTVETELKQLSKRNLCGLFKGVMKSPGLCRGLAVRLQVATLKFLARTQQHL